MSDEPWRKHFWRNTATNYLSTIIRMGTGLVLFRLLFQHLTREQFGYYSLLWSLFGYAILLDFGLGFSVQKIVAQKSTTGDMAAINRLVSTIFWTFTGLATALLILFTAIEPWFLACIKVAPASRPEFGAAYLVFFAAMAFNFPLALFPEMLRGLHRLDIVNWTLIVSQAVNLGLMVWALFAHWAFPIVVLISVSTTAAPNIGALFLARHYLPGLSLKPSNFHFPEVRGILSFSLTAYLITFTNLIMLRADQGVISVTLGVAFVAIYQVGYKAADTFGIFAKQIQEAVSPAAAHLGGKNDKMGIRDLLFKSSRFTILLTTPVYAFCAAYLDPVIKVLSGLKHVDTSTFWVGQALLLATYSSTLTNSCPKRVLVMCGWEKPLLKVSATDAALNFLFSILLVYRMGVLGVAVGTLIPTIRPILVPITASLVALGVLVAFCGTPTGLIGCAWRGAIVFGIALYFGMPHFRSILHKPIPAAEAAPAIPPAAIPVRVVI
jgi:O-antigen/teichoic acid export membrane protein